LGSEPQGSDPNIRLQQGLELSKMYRYNRRLSPGHVPGLFMFGNKIVCPVFA